jgi:8-oxo-dGTP pyrophosphatase MutT (NUDIX family)
MNLLTLQIEDIFFNKPGRSGTMKYEFDKDNFEILLPPEDFLDKDLYLKSIPRKNPANRKVYEIIEEEWDRYSAIQISSGKHDYLTITSLFRYEGHKTTEDDVIINLSQTDYKEVYGTNIKHPEIYSEFGNDFMGNALGICCLIRTKDNRFLIFKRAENVLELPGYYHLCAGHFERGKDTIERQADVVAAMKREMAEEVSISQMQINEIIPVGLCRSLISYKPELLFKCTVNLTSDSISENQFNFEHKEGFLLDEKELVQFLLKHHAKFVPAGKANIICHLISKYGAGYANEILSSQANFP